MQVRDVEKTESESVVGQTRMTFTAALEETKVFFDIHVRSANKSVYER